ncbi:hypothetical protein BBAD15_g11844 [Beauveria bassiana D1-5]|uniref:C2H2-type domain-containing protein n=1 Tax=Beauveria bassiana D1-5 TaxID=1245745 RepID=A0A0A2V611_BEABA|nr:hypothetical protein BBAD15_g11844 [Beauveria bassiana D1-5]
MSSHARIGKRVKADEKRHRCDHPKCGDKLFRHCNLHQHMRTHNVDERPKCSFDRCQWSHKSKRGSLVNTVGKPSRDQQMTQYVQQSFYIINQGSLNVTTLQSNIHPSSQVPHMRSELSSQDMTAPVRSSASLALVAGQCPTVREDHLDSYVTHNATAVQQQLMQQDTQHMPSETWCFNEHYPAPETEQFCEPQAHVTVAVAPLDQLPAYGYGIFNLYGGQIEFIDLSIQSSGCRIASLYS